MAGIVTLCYQVIHIYCAVHLLQTCACCFFQSVPVQTPVRRRAVCTGREADAQTDQERQVGVGGRGGSHTVGKSHILVVARGRTPQFTYLCILWIKCAVISEQNVGCCSFNSSIVILKVYLFCVSMCYFLGDRTGRTSLSLCPKTSTFTWKKLQSTTWMPLVKQTLLYLHPHMTVQVQTLLKLCC